MNELKILEDAKKLLKSLEGEKTKAQPLLASLIASLTEIVNVAYDEAKETEAGRRWFFNLVEKRSIPALALKEANIKMLLQEFDYSLPQEEMIATARIYLLEIERIINSGKGRYISG
ncbi:MAG: hypothetical protein D8M58_16580 [Calditrichaeota bacterium]|nr:MAG: hypothetical protein DWQ03_08310 [Calditrichota bacterium]MBL1207022.1 hypothetical protein [Calditrichota bacterium]NOG46849.1 hypothetical protein [Calditrichota bacterium]